MYNIFELIQRNLRKINKFAFAEKTYVKKRVKSIIFFMNLWYNINKNLGVNMQKIKLKKAENRDIKQISELLKQSDYNYENFFIKKMEIEKIIEFVKENLENFTLYCVNDKITAFSIAYSLKKPINKKDYFEKNYGLIEKIKRSLFSKKNSNEKTDDFVIDYIYFDEKIEKNPGIFLKYLEFEKIRINNSN